MSYFLLVITFALSSGQKGVETQRFDSHAECFEAMQKINDVVPGLSAVCLELKKGG
jgi:hypothetical protein